MTASAAPLSRPDRLFTIPTSQLVDMRGRLVALVPDLERGGWFDMAAQCERSAAEINTELQRRQRDCGEIVPNAVERSV